MKHKCLIATSFQGLEEELNRLKNIFNCYYEPDLLLPQKGYEKIKYLIVNPNNLKWRVDQFSLSALPELEYILTISTGISHIDIDYLEKKKIKLISLKDKTNLMNSITATAELAFLFFLAKSRNFLDAININNIKSWDWRPVIGKQLNEYKVGIVGYGRLGKLFDTYCKAFNVNTLWYDPNLQGGAEKIDEIFINCSVISLHASYKPGQKEIINNDLLKLARSDLHLINTARGELIDEDALSNFLIENKNAFYSADVIRNEIFKEESSIYKLYLEKRNVTLTPHIGGMTAASRNLAYNLAINELLKYLKL